MKYSADGTKYDAESIRNLIDEKYEEDHNGFPNVSDLFGADWGACYPMNRGSTPESYRALVMEHAARLYDDDAGFFIE